MGISRQILLCCFSLSAFILYAQQPYNPFQYGNNPASSSGQVITPQNLNDNINQVIRPSQPYQPNNGNSGQDIIAKQNAQAMQMMNASVPMVPPKDPYLAHLYILQQAQQSQSKQLQELQSILDEINKNSQYIQPLQSTSKEDYSSPEFKTKTKPLNDALQALKDMLSGKQKLSVADAYFTIENAYGSNYLSYKEYKETISKSVSFIKTWMQQNGYSLANREQVNLAIQKFMSQKLITTMSTGTLETGIKMQKVTHAPYFYDYNDFEAEKDHRNSFVTKCIATGSGQCASMPIVYLSLAQALGMRAYLTLAPQHSFVKYLDNKGIVQNYEPTTNWKINDNWYVDNMFVNEDAKRSGIFLDTINYRQMVAMCVLQLADFYMRKFGAGDGTFVEDCLKTADVYFPKKNSLDWYVVKSEFLKVQLFPILQANNIKDLKDVGKVPQALQLFKQVQAVEQQLRLLGYDDQPKGLYESLMEHQEFGAQLQKFKGIEGKQKRNLFQVSK